MATSRSSTRVEPAAWRLARAAVERLCEGGAIDLGAPRDVLSSELDEGHCPRCRAPVVVLRGGRPRSAWEEDRATKMLAVHYCFTDP